VLHGHTSVVKVEGAAGVRRPRSTETVVTAPASQGSVQCIESPRGVQGYSEPFGVPEELRSTRSYLRTRVSVFQ